MTIFRLQPGGKLVGEVSIPGDKSVSHRAIMLGSLAEGVTEVEGFLEGEDNLSTLNAFRRMGVGIEDPCNGRVVIHGVGLHGLSAPQGVLDAGNAGTAMRLLTGVLAAQAFDSQLTGDASLVKRPMKRVTEPLTRMGAWIETTPEGTAPLFIHGGRALQGIHYISPVASAQVKSCLLLAGMYAEGKTFIQEPAPTRDHTERMLMTLGYPVERDPIALTSCLIGQGQLTGGHITVPADISSSAFFLVGASIAPDSELYLKQIGINPTRTGVIDILRQMGANITIENERSLGSEPVADIVVKSAPLHGITIAPELVPLAIDEFPAIFIAAACAEGETRLSGAQELRVKESDRIGVMAQGLQALGIQAEAMTDGVVIQGGNLKGGTIDSHGDHRIAMAFAMAALRSQGTIEIKNCANVNTSFPGFANLAAKVGLGIAVA